MKSGPAPALSGSTPQMDKGAHDALPDPETEGADGQVAVVVRHFEGRQPPGT